MVKKKGMT